MSQKRTAAIAWALSALCAVSALTQAIIWLAGLTASPSLFDLVETFGWGLALPVLFSVVAALIIARQPHNRVGWLLMLPAVVIASPVETIMRSLPAPPAALTPGLWLLLWVSGWSWIPVIFPVMLIPLHFPTGRPPSPRWRGVNWLAIGMWLFFAIFISFGDVIGPINESWTVPNPIGLFPLDTFDRFWIAWGGGLAALVSLSVASLIVRYRRAQFRERQQIKWLLYAGATFGVYYVLGLWLEENARAQGLLNLLFVCSILGMPVAIAIAILRYRLYDIDIIIRKTLLYGALTALLALIYFGSVLLLQSVVGRATAGRSPLIIVLSTLLIAALFSPLRRRLQATIDRRFYRQKYDAQQVLAQFAHVARDEVELEALTAELHRVVQRTMNPERVSVWLKPAAIREAQRLFRNV